MNELPNILSSLLIVLAIPYLRRAFFFRPAWRVETKKSRVRIPFFDILRGIAIIAVIGIHAVDFYRLELHTLTRELLFLNATLRFAIPLFLIASGMLLDPYDLHNSRGMKSFYRRKLFRIFLPYAAVSILWAFIQADSSLLSLPLHLIRGDMQVPYYFVIVLFELYALYPILVRLASRRWFLYGALGISMAATAMQVWYLFGVPLPFDYIFFFAYGIALRPLMTSPKADKSLSILPWLGIAVCYFATFFMIRGYYYNAVYFWGPAVFWICYLQQQHLPRMLKAGFAYVGRLSLWIFLLHYPILFWLGEHNVSFLRSLPIGIGIGFLLASTLAISLLLAIGITKIIKSSKRVLHAAVVNH